MTLVVSHEVLVEHLIEKIENIHILYHNIGCRLNSLSISHTGKNSEIIIPVVLQA